MTIDLADGCCDSELSAQFLEKLGGYRKGFSILEIPETWDEYWSAHQTARKRVRKSGRQGFVCRDFDRSRHENDIFEIHRSMPNRQGRPMHDWYQKPQSFQPLPDFPCPRHSIRTLGVFSGSALVAYLLWYIVGDFATGATVLGHGDCLESGIMYLLFFTAIRQAQETGVRFFGYHLHSSGTDGLRFFKERLGFAPMDVEWIL